MSFEDSVLAGVKFLDKRIPRWRQLIDWSVLDIWSIEHCVIGQLREKYSWDVMEELGIDAFYKKGVDYGFETPEDMRSDEFYAFLTEAWKSWAESEGLYKR